MFQEAHSRGLLKKCRKHNFEVVGCNNWMLNLSCTHFKHFLLLIHIITLDLVTGLFSHFEITNRVNAPEKHFSCLMYEYSQC